MSHTKLVLYYPSGNVVEVLGDFKGLHGPPSGLAVEVAEDVRVGDQVVTAGSILIADPRCVCVAVETGTVLYNPREHLIRLEPNWKEWLAQNPAWPDQLELATPTRKYSPPPWVWSDAGGREAFSLRAENGMPVVAPVMMLAPGHDVRDRSKAFDKAKAKARAKMAAVAPNPVDAAILMNAARLLEACQALYDATAQDLDPSRLEEARKTAAEVIRSATTPFPVQPNPPS
jgi:hypothetical protein